MANPPSATLGRTYDPGFAVTYVRLRLHQGTRSVTRSLTYSNIAFITTSIPSVTINSAIPGQIIAHAATARPPITTSPFRAELGKLTALI